MRVVDGTFLVNKGQVKTYQHMPSFDADSVYEDTENISKILAANELRTTLRTIEPLPASFT